MCRGGGEKLQIFENNYDSVIRSGAGWGGGGGGREKQKKAHMYLAQPIIYLF